MNRKEVVFDTDEFIRALEETADHVGGRRKLTMRATKVVLPKPAEAIRPDEGRAIREKLKVSQAVFA